MKLIVIDFPLRKPHKNHSLETRLLDIKDNFIVLRFWINEPSVFIGRFQKVELEVNKEFTRNHNIPIIRRFSGGGTVYHDPGTLNISFCKPRHPPPLISNYIAEEGRYITEIIKQSIETEKIPFTVDARNGIYRNGKKLLGSAIALKKEKFFYHASLLVDTNLQNLYNCINWHPNYSESNNRYVKSVRSTVINLSDLYPITIEQIKQHILRTFKETLSVEQTIFIKDGHQLRYFSKVRNL